MVAIDRELGHLLEPLQVELPHHEVVAGTEPERADVYVTTRTDPGKIRALLRQHRDLVIIVVYCSAQFPRALEHHTFVTAVNAGAAAFLVDAPAPLVAAHVAHVGRSRPRRMSHPRHWVAHR